MKKSSLRVELIKLQLVLCLLTLRKDKLEDSPAIGPNDIELGDTSKSQVKDRLKTHPFLIDK